MTQVIISVEPIVLEYNNEFVAKITFMHGDADDNTESYIGLGVYEQDVIAFHEYLIDITKTDDRLGGEDICNEIMQSADFTKYFGEYQEDNSDPNSPWTDWLWPWDNTLSCYGELRPAAFECVEYFFYSNDRYIYRVEVIS